MTKPLRKAPAPQAVSETKRSAVAFGAALKIARAWGITEEQLGVLLGGVGRSTIYRWIGQYDQDRTLPLAFGPDVLDRIGLLLGIYKALRILFTDSVQSDGWVKRPNQGPGFGGQTALDRMLKGRMDDLIYVRTYLGGWRG